MSKARIFQARTIHAAAAFLDGFFADGFTIGEAEEVLLEHFGPALDLMLTKETAYDLVEQSIRIRRPIRDSEAVAIANEALAK